MNLLDENILESQRQLLRSWRVPVRQIGVEIGPKGLSDENILPLLRRLHTATLFTRDLGFGYAAFCHSKYSIVVLAVRAYEAAHFVRRTIRHPEFDSFRKRAGLIIVANPTGLAVLGRQSSPVFVPWTS